MRSSTHLKSVLIFRGLHRLSLILELTFPETSVAGEFVAGTPHDVMPAEDFIDSRFEVLTDVFEEGIREELTLRGDGKPLVVHCVLA